jgi:nicotinate-nucleotide adenylyltransferase
MSGHSRVCLFGGTFDPIHNAHLRIATEAKNKFHLDRVLFVPAGSPPHKVAEGVTPYEDRFQMVLATVGGIPGFEASRLEEGSRKSYTIETVERLLPSLEPGAELFFLIGSDAFDEIESWRRWQDLVRLVTFIVAARPGREYRTPTGARVLRLDSVALETSSSDIRSRLSAGELPDELPETVKQYIVKHGLYGWPASVLS